MQQDETRHVPVMLAEVLRFLQPRDGGIYVDGTFGAGGYTRAILEHADCRVIAIDRDPVAIAGGRQLRETYGERLSLAHGRFSRMEEVCSGLDVPQVDGVVLDLGVSSMQLDDADRGFSFRFDGPLDMRMSGASDPDLPSAADVVNTYAEGDLARIIAVYGEEKFARQVAAAIVLARQEKPFERTLELAETVRERIGARMRKSKIDPATRTFQALRIYVNGELDEVAGALCAAERILGEGGRLVVVSFHSLEDRIVKRFLAERCGRKTSGSRHLPPVDARPASFGDIARGGVGSGERETDVNPRARSARLRAGRRTAAEAWPCDMAAMGLPDVSRSTRRAAR